MRKKIELQPDHIKCFYRLNFTKTQAALVLGIRLNALQKKIDDGEIGINLEKGEEKVSRCEIENYLRSKTIYAPRKKKEADYV